MAESPTRRPGGRRKAAPGAPATPAAARKTPAAGTPATSAAAGKAPAVDAPATDAPATDAPAAPGPAASADSAPEAATATTAVAPVLTKERGAAVPASERGRTSIADPVVAKIAGVCAREVPGVHTLGGGAARAMAAVRRRVPGGRPNVAQGVGVEVGERRCAVDLDIVVEYGVPIAQLAVAVRENVVEAIERMTALEVVEVNIAVDDVHLGDDDTAKERRIV